MTSLQSEARIFRLRIIKMSILFKYRNINETSNVQYVYKVGFSINNKIFHPEPSEVNVSTCWLKTELRGGSGPVIRLKRGYVALQKRGTGFFSPTISQSTNFSVKWLKVVKKVKIGSDPTKRDLCARSYFNLYFSEGYGSNGLSGAKSKERKQKFLAEEICWPIEPINMTTFFCSRKGRKFDPKPLNPFSGISSLFFVFQVRRILSDVILWVTKVSSQRDKMALFRHRLRSDKSPVEAKDWVHWFIINCMYN